MEQRSPEWFKAKLGKIGASKIKTVLSKVSAEKVNLMLDLAGERITGSQVSYFLNQSMKNGIEREPDAINAYEFEKNESVKSCGFISHPRLNFSGASPDGLIGEDGGIEVKCPELRAFLKWRHNGFVPAEHLPQIHWGMACTGRKWWDFVAYHPDMPHGLNLMIVRVNRDDELIERYEKEVMAFELELQEMVKKIRGM